MSNSGWERDTMIVWDGMKTIYRNGIACYKKHCKVISDYAEGFEKSYKYK